MLTTTGPTLRQAKARIHALQAMAAATGAFLLDEPGLREAAGPLMSAMEDLAKQRKAELLEIEKAEGCPECGAQSNENCRLDQEVGYCPWAEDMKEMLASPSAGRAP